MIPSLETTKLHYVGLHKTGYRFYTRCDKCQKFQWCDAYKKEYKEGLGARFRLCPECAEAMK